MNSQASFSSFGFRVYILILRFFDLSIVFTTESLHNPLTEKDVFSKILNQLLVLSVGKTVKVFSLFLAQ